MDLTRCYEEDSSKGKENETYGIPLRGQRHTAGLGPHDQIALDAPEEVLERVVIVEEPVVFPNHPQAVECFLGIAVELDQQHGEEPSEQLLSIGEAALSFFPIEVADARHYWSPSSMIPSMSE